MRMGNTKSKVGVRMGQFRVGSTRPSGPTNLLITEADDNGDNSATFFFSPSIDSYVGNGSEFSVIDSHGLTIYGVSTYWNSELLTVFFNGAVEPLVSWSMNSNYNFDPFFAPAQSGNF